MTMSPTSMMMIVAMALTMLQTSDYLDWLANGVNHSHEDFAHLYDINIHGDDSNNYVTDQ